MILFVDGCVRENSRTRDLAKTLLKKVKDDIQEVTLYRDGPSGLDENKLMKRDDLLKQEAYNNPLFDYANQFAKADTIVVAAPYWDLMFPAKVRAYFEEVTVSGITFRYNENGIPEGLCKAKKLIYVTTAGGPIIHNFGYKYVEALAETFYGIEEVSFVKAEGLDILGADSQKILDNVKQSL